MNIAAPLRHTNVSRSKFAPPLRLTPKLCGALAALSCLWLASVRMPAHGDEILPKVVPSSSVTLLTAGSGDQGALLKLRVGKAMSFPLPAGARYSVTGDAAKVKVQEQNAMLAVQALGAGRVELSIELPVLPGQATTAQKYSLRLLGESDETLTETIAVLKGVSTRSTSEAPTVSSGVGAMRIPPRQPALTAQKATVGSAVATSAGKVASLRTAMAAQRPTAPIIATSSKTTSSKQSTPVKVAAVKSTPSVKPVVTPVAKAAVAKAAVAKTATAKAATAKTATAKANAVKTSPRLASAAAASAVAAKATTVATKLKSVLSSSVPAPKAGAQLIARAQLVPDLPPILEKIPRTPANLTVPGSALAVPPVASTPADDRFAARNNGLAPIESASESADVVVTPNMAPPTVAAVGATYPLQSPLPTSLPLPPEVDATSRRPLYRVSQGMARLLAFKSNILSVFFSDDNIMDARAINARTIAVTGKGPGRSTLAVFLSRYPNDVVGRAVIYNIEVYPTVVRMAPVGFTDPIEAETAIRTALNDPRVRVSVLQRPDGSLVAQLSGGLRDKAEVDAAVAMASLFVPNVISSLYVDAQAPTLEQALNGPSLSGNDLLQAKLRSALDNETIELVTLPGGTVLTGTVDTAAQAETILSMLPLLGVKVQPLITVRGSTSSSQFYSSDRPVLYGEDYEMTRRMNEVTGVNTVFAVRTARNALAVYGTVRTRVEYDTVRRYANALLPQLQETVTTTQAVTTNPGVPGAVIPNTTTTATTSSVAATAPALSAAAGLAPAPATGNLTGLTESNIPTSASKSPIQLQMFVRVLDEGASAIRLVTVESSVVEVSRTALRDLGVQVGSATVLSETVDAENGGIVREIDPTFNLGTGLLGDFGGFGAFSNINPIRARIAALIQNGTARVLSKPNLTAVEGADAQITIGGVRPVPSTQTNSTGGATQTSVEFRRFGIILTMRPTVTDDDTIILQIRGDVTDLDPTTAINLSGAVIPGERVRSVDTTITLREGDTLVLGGLITNDSRKQTSKVPILGDIPILGQLFRSKRFENNETELAIFLTPRIRRQAASMNTKSGVELVPSLPPLPSLQDQQESVFGLTTAGQGS